MTVRWLLWSMISPSQLILFSIALGLLLLCFRRARPAARWFLVFGGGGLLLFGLLPTSLYLADVLEKRFPQPILPDRVDGIVLLAGAELPEASEMHGEPQVGRSGGRYVTTLQLAARYPEARIVFSGGRRREPGKGALETQPAVGERLLLSVGIDPRRVRFEEGSEDTCASGHNARAVARPRPGETWVVVTSAMHMPRTIACFRAGGWPEIIAQPANYRLALRGWNLGSIQVAENLALLDDAAHEWFGLAFYRISGRTHELFPAPDRPI